MSKNRNYFIFKYSNNVTDIKNSVEQGVSTQYSTPRNLISSSGSKGVTRSKVKLPENFHQKVIELENKFITNKTLELIQELLHLYKVLF